MCWIPSSPHNPISEKSSRNGFRIKRRNHVLDIMMDFINYGITNTDKQRQYDMELKKYN